MFQLEKLLETITKRTHKSPPTRKLQRSPKIIGYERSEYPEISSELKEPLLLSSSQECYMDNNYEVDLEKKKNNINNSSVRVKVVLTKEEAAKLLAKCKEGDLDFKDVVNQLVKLPKQKINVVSSYANNNISYNDFELATIIEDEEEENDES